MAKDILLLHGALGSRRQMDELATLLKANFNVHAFNFPGHGGRPLPEEYTMRLFVEDLAQFILDRRLQGTDVFGFSMGGYVALLLSMEKPDLIGKVMTLGTKFDWTPESAERESLFLDPDKIAVKVPDFAAMLAQRHAPQDWRLVVKRTHDLILRLGNGEAQTMSKFKLKQPVRITRGELDHMVTEKESKFISDRQPFGSYDTIIGFRHPLEQVEMEALSEHISAFMFDNNHQDAD